MSLRFKLPTELVTLLDSYAGQAGIQRPLLISALVLDFLKDSGPDSSAVIVPLLKPLEEAFVKGGEQKHVRLAYLPQEDEERLRDWAGRMATTPSVLMGAIIRNRFSDRDRLQAIVDKARERGFQEQLKMPEIDTSERDRTGVVAMLSPELRAKIEQLERMWSRTTAQQIVHILTEAVERQTEYDGPLPGAPPRGTERKLVRVPRAVHAKLTDWSKREKRSIQNQIVHILHKAVADRPEQTPSS